VLFTPVRFSKVVGKCRGQGRPTIERERPEVERSSEAFVGYEIERMRSRRDVVERGREERESRMMSVKRQDGVVRIYPRVSGLVAGEIGEKHEENARTQKKRIHDIWQHRVDQDRF
jgi:hypothetical protein